MDRRESQALAALRKHRAKIAGSVASASGGHSGDDYQRILEENARLNALAAKQTSEQSESRAYEQGKAAYNKRKAELSPAWRGKTQTLGELVRSVVPISPPEYDDNLFCYVNIAAEAVKQHLAGPSMLYDILKKVSRDTGGKNGFTAREIRVICAEYGISQRRQQRYLDQGAGIFWDVRQDKRDKRAKFYHLRGYHRIALQFDHPGEAVKLPIQAYKGTAPQYGDHVTGAWQKTHDTSSRDNQQSALGRTHNTLRAKQARASVRQETRIIQAPPPVNIEQGLELATMLQDREGLIKYHWFGKRGAICWQTTNRYHGGLGVLLGLGRSGYIRDRRVNGERKASICDTYPKTFYGSYRESAFAQADKYQQKTGKHALVWWGDKLLYQFATK